MELSRHLNVYPEELDLKNPERPQPATSTLDFEAHVALSTEIGRIGLPLIEILHDGKTTLLNAIGGIVGHRPRITLTHGKPPTS